jgi:ribosomal protein L10
LSAEEDVHICEYYELVCRAAGGFFCFASTEEGGNEMRDSKIDQKQPVVKEIAALLDGASSAVVVDYRGLTVEQDTQLRKQLREAGVVYKVYKNTMIRIAAKGTDFEKFDAYLEGPTALAVSKDDATVAARVLAKFAKTAPKLEIKGGIVEGAAYDAKGMAAIAAVPSREELLGRLFGSMQSPITNFARVIKQIAEKDAAPAAE